MQSSVMTRRRTKGKGNGGHDGRAPLKVSVVVILLLSVASWVGLITLAVLMMQAFAAINN